MGLFDFFKKPEATPEKAPTPSAAMQAKDDAGEPAGFFAGLQRALKKTADLLNTDVRDLFKKEGRLVDEQFLTELFAILVKTDMGVGPAARIRDKIGTDFRAR